MYVLPHYFHILHYLYLFNKCFLTWHFLQRASGTKEIKLQTALSKDTRERTQE